MPLLQAPEADYLDAAVVSVLQIHLTQPRGDVLVSKPPECNMNCPHSSLCLSCIGVPYRPRRNRDSI